MEALSLLLYLGRKGALSRPITIKTVSVGNDMRISQQSVSRWLIKLVSDGMITRKKGIKGYIVKVTAKGETILRDTKKELNSILVEARKVTITGRVVSGMNRGDEGVAVGIHGQISLDVELDMQGCASRFRILTRG